MIKCGSNYFFWHPVYNFITTHGKVFVPIPHGTNTSSLKFNVSSQSHNSCVLIKVRSQTVFTSWNNDMLFLHNSGAFWEGILRFHECPHYIVYLPRQIIGKDKNSTYSFTCFFRVCQFCSYWLAVTGFVLQLYEWKDMRTTKWACNMWVFYSPSLIYINIQH